MGYQIGLDMGISERAILATIEAIQKKGDGAFTYKDIASKVPCSEATIWRHMPKLIKAGKVKRIGIKHTQTCRYEVIKDEEEVANA